MTDWPTYIDTASQELYRSDLVEHQVSQVIQDCLIELGIPLPANICDIVCTPGPQFARTGCDDCCSSLDVWISQGATSFDAQKCLNVDSFVTVEVRLTRTANDEACGDRTVEQIKRALSADLYVLQTVVPAKLSKGGLSCCDKMQSQQIAMARICHPCLGWAVTYRLPISKPAVSAATLIGS